MKAEPRNARITRTRATLQKRAHIKSQHVAFDTTFGDTLNVQTVLTESPESAAEFIKRGGIVAFPTETVYGLGADVFDERAIRKIFDAKMRPADNPLIAHVGSVEEIKELTTSILPDARTLIDAFFPGPLTLVLRKAASVPLIATAGLDTIGVRMPSASLANTFLRACGVPVVAPSANLSGRPSPTTWQAVFEDLDGRIDCILQANQTIIGLESTVVDCTADVPIVLRKGAVSLESLRVVIPEIGDYDSGDSATARSPGLKHKHYSPRSTVILAAIGEAINVGAADAYIGLTKRADAFKVTMVCGNVDDYARSLFEFFRECDRAGIDRIYCEPVVEDGIGAALMDRIRRASVG